MPTDPRSALGACGAAAGPIFSQSFQSWMTGGAGAGALGSAQTLQYPYPPVTLEDTPFSVTLLPSYTSTGAISTLPAPTYTNSQGHTINAGNGWFNAQDTLAAPTPIAGCTYPDAWDALSVSLPPAGVCGGGAAPARAPSLITSTSTGAATTTAAAPVSRITSPFRDTP